MALCRFSLGICIYIFLSSLIFNNSIHGTRTISYKKNLERILDTFSNYNCRSYIRDLQTRCSSLNKFSWHKPFKLDIHHFNLSQSLRDNMVIHAYGRRKNMVQKSCCLDSGLFNYLSGYAPIN